MRFESYTLPIIALLTFVGVLSVHVSALTVAKQAPIATDSIASTELKHDIFSSQVAGVAGSVVSDSTLAALFSFDEGEGVTLLDRSQYGAAGVLYGDPVWSDGVDGSSLYFDGIDDYATVKDNTALNILQSFTLASWVMPDKFSGGTVLSKNGSGGSTESLYFLAISQGRMQFGVHNSITLSAGGTGIEPQQWSYTAVTYDSETVPNTKLYVNGRHVLSSNIPSLKANTTDLFIGRGAEGDYFKGRIDDVRVYSKALSGSEITNLFKDGESKIVAQQQAETSENSSDDTSDFFTSLFQKIINIFNKK